MYSIQKTLTGEKFTVTKRNNDDSVLVVNVRFDDECSNSHKTFSIIGEYFNTYHKFKRWPNYCDTCGCIHDLISKYVPELQSFIKWHLTSTDGPMHYIANTVYHVKNNDFDYARNSAVWLDATVQDLHLLNLEQRLKERLPKLMEEFKKDMKTLGFIY